MRGLTGDELVGLPVRLRGITLGRTVDVLLHPTAAQALGLDVLCGDGTHRFLPFSAAAFANGSVEPGSPLVLLDLEPGSFYRQEARALSELRGATVGPGTLRDVVLGADWTIAELIVDDRDAERRIPLDGLILPRRATR